LGPRENPEKKLEKGDKSHETENSTTRFKPHAGKDPPRVFVSCVPVQLCSIGAVADCPNENGDILFIVTRKTDFPPGDRWLLVTGPKFRRSQMEYDLSIESQTGLIDTVVPTDSVEP
jgi:hypothetical protein